MGNEKLRYFAAVVETRNVRKASEIVGITPPSMSKAISSLYIEEYVGRASEERLQKRVEKELESQILC